MISFNDNLFSTKVKVFIVDRQLFFYEERSSPGKSRKRLPGPTENFDGYP